MVVKHQRAVRVTNLEIGQCSSADVDDPSPSVGEAFLAAIARGLLGVLLHALVGVGDVLGMQHLGVAQLLGNAESVDE
jgi:hypothetical protein